MSRTNSHTNVVSMLATNYDLRCCRNISRKGELLGMVFTELLDKEYPQTGRWLATLYYAFPTYLTNQDSWIKSNTSAVFSTIKRLAMPSFSVFLATVLVSQLDCLLRHF